MSNDDFTMSLPGLGIALLLIAFWGEPDLVDVLIKYIISITV